MAQTERDLVNQVLKGDQLAFQAIYHSYKKALIRACWYFLGEDADVEDVIQDTFIKALKNLRFFRFECSLGTWLNHIAVNLCRDLLEQKKKNLPFSLDFFSSLPSIDQKPPYTEETVQLVRREIENLEGREKEIVNLRDLKGLSYEAIANRLRIPIGTVTSTLYRARNKIIERVRERLPKGEEIKI